MACDRISNPILDSMADDAPMQGAHSIALVNPEDGARLRLKKSLKRLYTDYKDISKELPLPKRGKAGD